MTDCQSAEIRDQLPDLLHDRLSAEDRTVVLAHVDACADCREELNLLRGVLRALVTSTPRIDTARIAAALPTPASRTIPITHTRSRWADWRIAATITVLAAGVSSVAVLSRGGNTVPAPVAPSTKTTPAQPTTPSDLTPVASAESANSRPARANVSPVVPARTVAQDDPALVDQPEVSMEGRLNGLSEQQLRALLNDINQMKAVPITEPEPVTINVNSRASSGAGAGTDWL